MTSLAKNAANDIYLGPDGNIAVVRDLDAVIQDCESMMYTQLGEVALDTSIGVPTLDTIWLGWKPGQFEAAARAALAPVPGVVAVRTFEITRAGGVAFYTAQIETIYGIGTATGSLEQ